jgi:hypothetical protein
MNKKWLSLLIALGLLCGGLTLARAAPGLAPLAPQGSAAPTVVSYQGRVQVSGAPFTGTGYFKFAIVNQAGNTTYWSNDGTSSGGSEPTTAVPLPVSNGLFTVLLGDTSLDGMTQQLSATVFSGYDRYLRIWFRAGGSGAFTRLTPDTPIAAVPYALQAQHAAPPGNVVIVARMGNGDFTSIQAAINSITSASSSNPYLVWVGPGWYNETVTLKPYVHLQGAGQRVTFIQAAAPNGAVLTLSSDTTVRDLSVSNIGNGTTNYGMYGDNVTIVQVSNVYVEAGGGGATNIAIGLKGDTQVTLENVTAFAGKTGGDNIGLRVAASPAGGPEITAHGGTFTGSGGTNAYGIQVDGGLNTFLDAADVRAYGQDASNTNVGLSNSNYPTVLLQGGFFRGSGGQYAYGMENYNGAHLEAEGVTAQAEGGSSYAKALYNHVESRATLRGGSFTAQAGGGSAYAIHNFGSNTVLEAHDVTALAAGGTYNYGLIAESNTPITRVNGGTFTGQGGSRAVGINHANVGETTIQNAFAVGENGTANYGLDVSAGTVRADGCHFKSNAAAVRETGGTLYLAVSQLDGGMQRTGGTRTCFQVYDGSYIFYSCP